MTDIFNIYVGSETGLLKAVNVDKKTWCNVNKPSTTDRKVLLNERQIEALCWSDNGETQACFGLTNHTVFIYDVASKDFVKSYQLSSGVENDALVALAKYGEDYLVCSKSGILKLWSVSAEEESECKLEIKSGDHIDSMRQNTTDPNLVATGGRLLKNELKIWDLNNPTEPIFKAKNVRNDFLNLEVPVWVTDMAFLPDSKKIVTCTGHHQIRIYDPSQQRRPVMDIEWAENPMKRLCLRPNGYHAIVGNSLGDMALIDLRGKAYVVQKYKGGAGSIRDLQCHPTQNVVASCGLDRYIRIHDIESQKLLQKFYLKSKLNCLLFGSTEMESFQTQAYKKPFKKAIKEDVKDNDIQGEESDDGDDIWEKLEDVKNKSAKRTHGVSANASSKNKKRRKQKMDKMNKKMDTDES